MKVKAYCTMRQVQYAFTCRVPVCYKKTTLIIFLLSQSKSQLVKKKFSITRTVLLQSS